MSNGNGHRWSKFWWGDWQNDPALKQCSFAAQGLWMRLLCLAHEATRYGSVLINGHVPTPKQLVAQVGGTEREVAKLLGELEREGVFSRDPDGTIYSRRMRRDEDASEVGKQWGKRGGNPALNPREGLTPPVNPDPGNGVNPDPYLPPLNQPVNHLRYLPPLNQSQKLEAEAEAEGDSEARRESSFFLTTEMRAREAGQQGPEEWSREAQTTTRPLVQAIAKALKTDAYPPRSPIRDSHDQIDQVGPKRTIRPSHLTPAQLAIARRRVA